MPTAKPGSPSMRWNVSPTGHGRSAAARWSRRRRPTPDDCSVLVRIRHYGPAMTDMTLPTQARRQTAYWLAAAALVIACALILLAMGREPICKCGYVKLWHGVVMSSENSQHISDWYTPSHLIHGFIFYCLLWLIGRRWPLGLRLCLAITVEGGWEIFENTDFIINRY